MIRETLKHRCQHQKHRSLPKNPFAVPLVLLLSFLVAGCAEVSVKQINNTYGSTGMSVNPGDTSGIRFYRPALHVWITTNPPSDKLNVTTSISDTTQVTRDASAQTAKDEKTNKTTSTTVVPTAPNSAYTAKFEMLPDYSQEYIIQWDPGIGSVNPSFDLDGGWNLTKFASQVDSKAADNMTGIGTMAGAFTGALVADPNFKGAGLYKMEFDSAARAWTLGVKVLSLE